MAHPPLSSTAPTPPAQVFVLRVPGDACAAEVEHVTAGQTTCHDSLGAAFAQITSLLDPADPSGSQGRWH